MKQLPAEVQAEVQAEFDSGNWVVKGSPRRFNQDDPDQGQEWLNGTGKRGGDIVGITRTTAALCRWTLSFNLRAHIAALTREMYHIDDDDHIACNESNPSRNRRDNDDEKKVICCIRRTSSTSINKDFANVQKFNNCKKK